MPLNTQKQADQDKIKTPADRKETKEKAREFIEKMEKEIKKPQMSERMGVVRDETQKNPIKQTREKIYQYQLNNLSLTDDIYEDKLYLKSISFDEYTTLNEVNKFYKKDFAEYLNRVETMKNPGLEELNKIVKIHDNIDDWCGDEKNDFIKKEKAEEIDKQKKADDREKKMLKPEDTSWLSRGWRQINEHFTGNTPERDDDWFRQSETESFRITKNIINRRCEDAVDKIIKAKIKEITDSSQEIADSLFEGKIIHDKNLRDYIEKSLAYSHVLPIRETTDRIFKFGDFAGVSELRSWKIQDFTETRKDAMVHQGRVLNDDNSLIDWIDNREILRKTLNHEDFNLIDKNIYRDYTSYTPRENHTLMIKLLELDKPIDGDVKNQFDLAKKFTKNFEIKKMIDAQEKKGAIKDKKFANKVAYVEAKRLFNSDKQLKVYGLEQYEKDLTAITAHLTGLDDKGREADVKKIGEIYQTDIFNRSKLVKQEFFKSLMAAEGIDQSVYRKMYELTGTNNKDIKQLLKNINKLTIYRKLNRTELITNINSMPELSDELDKRNIKEVSDIFKYTPEECDLIKEKLPNLEKEFEIVTQLASHYKEKGFDEQNNVLGELFLKIANGGDSFINWKYSAENLESQLDGMTEVQKKNWMTDTVSRKEYLGAQSNQATEKVATIRSLVNTLPDEINFQLDPESKMSFNTDEWQNLKGQRKELQTKIADAKGKDADAKKLKTSVDNKLRILDFYFSCQELDTNNFDATNFKKNIGKLEPTFKKMGLDPNVLYGLRTILDEDLKKSGYYEAKETSNYSELLNVGVNPIESCQSWRNGRYNENLLAYVVDGNKKIIQVRDGNNDLLARSVVKIVSYKNDKVLMPERIYTRIDSHDMRKLFIETFLDKADKCDASIILSDEWLKAYGMEEMKDFTADDLAKVVDGHGYSVKQMSETQVKLPESNNKKEYSDILDSHQIENFNATYKVRGVNFLLEKKKI